MRWWFRAKPVNTGPMTINGLALVQVRDGKPCLLAAGDLEVGRRYEVEVPPARRRVTAT